MIDTEFYEKLNGLKSYPNFINCLKLAKHKIDKEFHMELILRMYIGYQDDINYDEYGPLSSLLISDFFDNETRKLIKNSNFDDFIEIFKKTFDKFFTALEQEAFKKYDPTQDKFSGAFSVAIFEMLTTGVAKNIDYIESISDGELVNKIKAIQSDEGVLRQLRHGVKAINRFKELTAFSKEYFVGS